MSEKEGTEAQVADEEELGYEEKGKSQIELNTPQNPEDVGSSTATVKVVLVPEGHVMTVAFAIGLSIQKLKCHLASELRVPVEVLQLSLNGTVLEEQLSLIELGIRPHSSTRMEMSSTEPDSHPLRPLPHPEHDSMPDVITVQVQKDEGQLQEVVVEIEHPRQQMAFVGGYRHRLTGVEYHHAGTQTPPVQRPDKGIAVYSRDTQTAELRSKTQQCPVDVSTQMPAIHSYIFSMREKIVTPGNYTTAEEYHSRRVKAVICLQSWARCWLARKFVEHLRQARNRRLAWLEMMEVRRKKDKEEYFRDRRQRCMIPRRRDDFNLLYEALLKWRKEEEEQINSSLRGAEKKAALCALLEQETLLIATIGRHRIAVQSNNYDKIISKLLDKSAAPLQWQAADGRTIELDNPNTIRARELRDLYNNVDLSAIEPDHRLQVLVKLRKTVTEHKSKLTRDIVDLIDREVDLLNRGVNTRCLEGLRKRICTLFLQYIKTPAFNPGIAKHLMVPQDPSKLGNKFQHDLGSKVVTVNASVPKSQRPANLELDNTAQTRVDLSSYGNILMKLRAEEEQINNESKIPFLLQVEDMQYLMEVFWGSCSALSKNKDIYNLVFVRWERDKNWSPWNCILLSTEEALAHLDVEDVHKEYEATFILGIQYKLSQARLHFSHIGAVAEYLESTPVAENQHLLQAHCQGDGKECC